MKSKFKVGDEVICTRLGNDREGDRYAIEDGLEVGEKYKVTMIGDNGIGEHGEWVEISDGWYWHHQDSFRIAGCDAIVITLRRPVDRKSVEAFLNSKGYFQNSGLDKKKSRIIVVHLTGRNEKSLTYSAKCKYDKRANEARKHADKFVKDMFGFENVKHLSSKPSVNELINELKRYM